MALGERKYFSGQSAIKISDNIYPPSLLRDSEIRVCFAVQLAELLHTTIQENTPAHESRQV